jgi:two-component system response regulator (stage 0 sporulation protein A)
MKKILICDNEEFIVDEFAEIFEEIFAETFDDIKIVKAYDGQQCIRLVDTTVFDLIMIDSELKKYTGLQILDQISLMRAHLRPLQIFVTTETNEDRMEFNNTKLPLIYINKPVDLDMLKMIIEKSLYPEKADVA